MFKSSKNKLWAHLSHIPRNPTGHCADSQDAASKKWKLKSRQRQLGNSLAPGSGQKLSLPQVMFDFLVQCPTTNARPLQKAAGITACLKEINIWASLASEAAKLIKVPVTTLALGICTYRKSFLFSLEINWFLPHRWDLQVSLYCFAGLSLRLSY